MAILRQLVLVDIILSIKIINNHNCVEIGVVILGQSEMIALFCGYSSSLFNSASSMAKPI